ncbi:serine hydrolase [Mesobacillus harenae]|uniref:serine hydrolase n=1 Tax=Mesobacillus harenae TaxID=2213203 RepID=UPI001F54B0B0|nr:serine hydrolase [Mesobacillus harenae]
MEMEKARLTIEEKLKGMVDADPNLHNAYLLIHSEKHKIHWNMAHGLTDDVAANAEQPYHTASIGKTFTALIIAKLTEEGKISMGI